MKRLSVPVLVAVAAATLVLAACTQAAPAPAPTQAPAVKPAEATKAPAAAAPTTAPAAAPTKAPAAAAAPTAAPAKKVDFPTKGKVINFIVPSAAGSGSDLGARLLAPMVEKDLSTTMEVINRVGAGTQVGVQELSVAKPDGYTMGVTALPTTITLYLDPKRQATFTGKSFVPIVNHVYDPGAMAVKADSKYKTVKDLIDAAKANPEKIKMGVTGIKGREHLDVLGVQQAAGVKFANVFHDSSSLALTALMGGHLDAMQGSVGDFTAQVKSGEVRLIGVMDKQESKFAPGVKTFESEGFKIYSGVSRGFCAPAGTPAEIVSILEGSFKKAIASEEQKTKLEELGLEIRYMSASEYAAYWNSEEARIKPLMDLPD